MKGKKFFLGVTGSIAAYKSASLVRLLVTNGATVRVIMTKDAAHFITPLTMSTLSKNEVYTDFVAGSGHWNNHVELGLWADALVIAPASANTMAKMANGLCDNLLMATYLSAKCPVFFAPAMDLDMWKHPATKRNLEQLHTYGNLLIPVGQGELASGLNGEGRMAEPEEIVALLEDFLAKSKLHFMSKLCNKTILLTTGPTREPIDPVRFISNYSSGKMGFALAEEAVQRGAKVLMVKGPTSAPFKNANVQVIEIQTAAEMYNAVNANMDAYDIVIYAAAVADYTPKHIAENKIKKNDVAFSLELVKTKDIAFEMGKRKSGTQFFVGFALETDNEEAHALSKLTKKNLDMIVLNSLRDAGAGFQVDTNKITILDKQGNVVKFDTKSKAETAKDILDYVEKLLN